MSPSGGPPLSAEERSQMRQWLDNWRVTGPVLEQERVARIRALSDADAARMALDLWEFARPEGGDDGEGILPMRRALQKLPHP